MPAKGGKGTTWTPELERDLLVLAITAADVKPSPATWNLVAQAMGNGITASAVSQKFTKLKKGSEKEIGTCVSPTASPVSTGTNTPAKAQKKLNPAATERKRKVTAAVSDTSETQAKMPKQVKGKPMNDGYSGDGQEHASDGGVDLQEHEGHSVNDEKAADAEIHAGTVATAENPKTVGAAIHIASDGEDSGAAVDGAEGVHQANGIKNKEEAGDELDGDKL